MPPPSPELLRERLRDRIHERRTTARAVSLAIGANASYVAQILDGRGGMPSADRLARLAAHLETTVDALLNGSEGLQSDVSFRPAAPEWLTADPPLPGIPLVGTGDCADLTVKDEATGKDILVERSSFDPDFHVRYVGRPAALANAIDIYAIYFHGSSMEPRYYAGETGLVDPRRPAGPGDYVLVQLTDGTSDEVTSAMAKRLVRQNTKELVLEQHNPPQVFKVPRGRVARVHRIIPPSELLG